jgi:hypothetical protein
MQKITNLYLGKCNDCPNALAGGFNVILACHYPCSRSQWGSELPCMVLKNSTPPERIFHLDLPNQEIPNYKVKDFKEVLNRIHDWQKGNEVVVISEHAKSRAASLALLWLAFHEKSISRSSYGAARADFSRIYPQYTPWPGMVIFLNQEWEAFF